MKDALRDSDVVVKGVVDEVKTASKPSAPLLAAASNRILVMTVNRVLKGKIPEPRITAILDPCDGARPKETIILFSSSSDFGPPWKSTRNKLIRASSHNDQSPSLLPEAALKSEARLAAFDPDTAFSGANMLVTLYGKESISILEEMRTKKDAAIHFAAVSRLARFGSVDAFAEVLEFLDKVRKMNPVEERRYPNFAIASDARWTLRIVRTEVERGKMVDPRLGPLMKLLLRKNEYDIEIDAMAIARAVRWSGVLPYAAGRLDSGNVELRLEAAKTICMLLATDGRKCPDAYLSRADGSKYVSEAKELFARSFVSN